MSWPLQIDSVHFHSTTTLLRASICSSRGIGGGCVVAMALGHRRSWKFTVHAKISSLYIKLKATSNLPSGKFQRLIKLDRLLTGLNSKSESRILVQQRRTFKSRIISFVEKHFGRRRSKTSVAFKMLDPYLVAKTECESWRLGRVELSGVATFGVGFGYLLAEFAHALKRNVGTIPCSSFFVLVCLVVGFICFMAPQIEVSFGNGNRCRCEFSLSAKN